MFVAVTLIVVFTAIFLFMKCIVIIVVLLSIVRNIVLVSREEFSIF